MAANERQKLTEDELFFYEDRVCGEADLVYRFAFALSLNQEAAQKLLLNTYKDAANSLSSMIGASNNKLRTALLKTTFELFRDGDKKGAAGSSPLVGLLGSLPLDARAALFAVDVGGLPLSAVTEIVKGTEVDLRKKLAMARKALMVDKSFS